MKSICGADCQNCAYGQNAGCKGCKASGACPFGKKCFIAKYIELGGTDSFNALKTHLINEFNALQIEGMPTVTELYALNGAFVNLEYPLPNGKTVKLLDDSDIYLGTQVECLFCDDTTPRCFGLVAGMDFLLVCEYGINCADPQIVVYKRR